jgi:hypothetical protein
MNEENELTIIATLLDEGYQVVRFDYQKDFENGRDTVCVIARRRRVEKK